MVVCCRGLSTAAVDSIDSLDRLAGGVGSKWEEGEGHGMGVAFLPGRPPAKTCRGSGGMREERDHHPCSLKMLVPASRENDMIALLSACMCSVYLTERQRGSLQKVFQLQCCAKTESSYDEASAGASGCG